jgi:hypothetical protein
MFRRYLSRWIITKYLCEPVHKCAARLNITCFISIKSTFHNHPIADSVVSITCLTKLSQQFTLVLIKHSPVSYKAGQSLSRSGLKHCICLTFNIHKSIQVKQYPGNKEVAISFISPAGTDTPCHLPGLLHVIIKLNRV